MLGCWQRQAEKLNETLLIMSNNHIFQTFRFFFQHFVSLYKYVDDAVFNEKRSVDTQRDLCSIVNRLTSRIAYRKRPPLKCHGNERYDNIYENRYVITSRRGGNREPGTDSSYTNRTRFCASIILSLEQYRQLHPIIIQHYYHYLNHAVTIASRTPILRIRYKSVAQNAAHAADINHSVRS